MKKLFLAIVLLLAVVAVNAQSLEDIVKKYSAATKQDKLASLKTMKITGKMSMMGMEMPVTMWMKNPNKIKTVSSINGQDIISVFDGVKGYQINPMTGSSTPVEMTPDQVTQTLNSNYFQNSVENYLKKGQLAMAGDENVNNKPAYKLKATIEGGNVVYLSIDKATNLLVKSSTSVNQGGMSITVDSFLNDYKETNGVLLPMRTVSSAQGMEFTITFDKVEVDIPIDDSTFKVK